MTAQSVAGLFDYNSTQKEHGRPPVGYVQYLRSGDFVEAVENWESEFLQMGSYVVLTAYLYQRGSAESKDPDAEDPDADYGEDQRRADSLAGPEGGVWRSRSTRLPRAALLRSSCSRSPCTLSGEQRRTARSRWSTAKRPFRRSNTWRPLWFESFQNWQSEFLAIGAMVVLSIYLRQRGSPESKPVAAPHAKTGSG